MGDLKSLMIEDGLLIQYNGTAPNVSRIDDFVARFQSMYERGDIASLHEREVHQMTCVYGRIAHRYSFYEVRAAEGDAQPLAVGVNSIQLLDVDGDWKIASIAWNDDNRGDGFFQRVLALD